ncbi:MAG: Rab family GTPase [Promethearchaeota archaeon]
MKKKKYVFKILVAGQGGVGKTTLLTRAVTGKFVQNTSMTIGVEFHLLNSKIGPPGHPDAVDVVGQLWDFGGQERFRFMLDSYVAGARGALLLYDLTRLRTLDGLEEWVKIIRKQDPNLPILFVGTKLDRVDDITVSDDYAREFLEPLNMFGHIKISSKDGTGVKQAFDMIFRRVLEINGVQVPPDDFSMPPSESIPFSKKEPSESPTPEPKPFTPTSTPTPEPKPFTPTPTPTPEPKPFTPTPTPTPEPKPFTPTPSPSEPKFINSEKNEENLTEEERKKKEREKLSNFYNNL